MQPLRLLPVIALLTLVTPALAALLPSASIAQVTSITDLFRQGNTAQDAGDHPAAEAIWRQVIRLDPSNVVAHYNLGEALQAQGNLEEAITALEQAIDLDPQDAIVVDNLRRALHNLRTALFDQGTLDASLSAIDFNPQDGTAYNNLGMALSAQGNLEEAIVAYRRAIDLNPQDATAYNNLGMALSAQRQFEEAIAVYRRAIDLAPQNAATYNNLGNALSEQRKFEEAIAVYRRAIDLAPDLADTHNNLGNALRAQGNLAEAIAAYRRAIDLNAEDAVAHHNLGVVLSEQRKFEEAIASFRRHIDLDSTPSLTPNTSARIIPDLGYLSYLCRSIARFTRLVESDPNNAVVQSNLTEDRRRLELEQSNQPPIVNDLPHVPKVEDEPLVTVLRPTARIITITPSDGSKQGAGWVFRREGSTVWLVTNRHVITDRFSLEVERIQVEFFSDLPLAQRPRYRAVVQHMATSDSLDLAVLRIEQVPADIQPLAMRPERVTQGDSVVIIGHPTDSDGVNPWVRVFGEVRDAVSGSNKLIIDANVREGFSGGPVVLQDTLEVVAIGTAFCDQGDVTASTSQGTHVPECPSGVDNIFLTYPIESVVERLRIWGIYPN